MLFLSLCVAYLVFFFFFVCNFLVIWQKKKHVATWRQRERRNLQTSLLPLRKWAKDLPQPVLSKAACLVAFVANQYSKILLKEKERNLFFVRATVSSGCTGGVPVSQLLLSTQRLRPLPLFTVWSVKTLCS